MTLTVLIIHALLIRYTIFYVYIDCSWSYRQSDTKEVLIPVLVERKRLDDLSDRCISQQNLVK